MGKNISISVIGLGKVGLCTGACFASKGYRVIGVDVDRDKITQINKGISPIDETGLQDLLQKAGSDLKATHDYDEAILNTDVTFIVVATPSLADGSFSNEYLKKAVFALGACLKKKKGYHLVVVTSTVMPQTIENVVKPLLEKVSGRVFGKDFGVVYNPEFIALGSVIRDFLDPDFILIGEINKKDGDILQEIYKKTCKKTPYFVRMSPVNAEITKISVACYVTTKISFANTLVGICESIKGGDAHVVCNALGMDSRIGSKCISPGLGFGGPCFPRDTKAFVAFARKVNAKAGLIEIVDEINNDQVKRVVKVTQRILSGSNKKKVRLAVLGLSYKPNTSIIKDSQALCIVQSFVKEGYLVTVWDPQAQKNAMGDLGKTVVYAVSAEDCVKLADLVVIAVPWDQFKKIDFVKLNKNAVVLDCWGAIDPKKCSKVYRLGSHV